MRIDILNGTVSILNKGVDINFKSIPPLMMNILNEGGLVPYIKKYGDFKLR